MRDKTIKSRARGSHLQLSKSAQDKSLDRVDKLPPSQGEQTSVGRDSAQGTVALHPREQQLDTASTNDPPPSERERLNPTDEQPGLRRHSTRLHTRQHSQDSEGTRVAPSAPSYGPQLGADGLIGRLASKRTGLARTNEPQPKVEDEEAHEAVKITEQLNASKPSYTSSVQPKVHGSAQVSPTTSWKDQQIQGNGDDNEDQQTWARLTRENLAQFDKMAGKKASIKLPLTDALGSTVQSTTKATSTTKTDFEIQAYENGLLEAHDSKPPTNLEDIYKRLSSLHSTPPPTNLMYQRYITKVEGALNEATMVFEVNRKLLKEYHDSGYKSVFNHAFTNFPKDVGFNNGLSVPQPDFIEGLELRKFLPFPVHRQIGSAVVNKDGLSAIVLPHLAGEWKGPWKNMGEARLQSRYDGAALVFARNEALMLLGKPDPPGHAEVMTFTTDGITLNLFAHYAISKHGKPEYHQYPVLVANLVGSYQGFKDGLIGLRNSQDYAKKLSYTLRDQLNEYWEQNHGGVQLALKGAPQTVANGSSGDANADEDEDEDEVVEQPHHPTHESPAQSCRTSCSVSSSMSCQHTDDGVPSGGQKRKASAPLAPPEDFSGRGQEPLGMGLWKRSLFTKMFGWEYHSREDSEVGE